MDNVTISRKEYNALCDAECLLELYDQYHISEWINYAKVMEEYKVIKEFEEVA